MGLNSIPRRLFFRIIPELTRVIQPLERRKLRAFHPAQAIHPPPVFIVGAPRSGSTVVYQLITAAFDVEYPTNLAALFYHSLYFGIRIQRTLLGSVRNNELRSENGRTPGWRGPHQIANFWYRWFPRSQHFVPGEWASAHDLTEMRRTIGLITSTARRPFVIKNLNNGQRLQAIHQILPESIINFTKRNLLDNAASIIAGRRRVLGDPNKWWGVEPRNIDELRGMPYVKQVVRQIQSIEQQIYDDLSLFPRHQWEIIELDDLINDPQEAVESIAVLFRRNGIDSRPNVASVVGQIRANSSPADGLTAAELESLRAEIAEIS